jgi:hypothetical protein
MNSIAKTLAAAAMGAVGVLTLMNVAFAQEATTDTPAVEAPAVEAPADSAADAADDNCPERDGSGPSSGSGTTDSTGANVGFRRL